MVNDTFRNIVLASRSPRRRALLEGLGFELTVLPANIPEVPLPGEDGVAYTRRLAAEKARITVPKLTADQWVLAADTTVVCDGVLLEKPTDVDDAMRMLRMLRGRWHEVTTSFCWLHRDGRSVVRDVTTRVKFLDLPDDVLARYVATGEPMDKAGAYGIQGLGSTLCERIEGSYTCVVGLPVAAVVAALIDVGGLTEFPFSP